MPAAGAAVDLVFVRDIVLELEIGVLDSERGRRQRVRFSAEAEVPVGEGARGPEGFYSYDLIREAIRAAEARGHVGLVETHAEEVAARILADHRVAAVTVRVEKLDVVAGAVGVSIRRSR